MKLFITDRCHPDTWHPVIDNAGQGICRDERQWKCAWRDARDGAEGAGTCLDDFRQDAFRPVLGAKEESERLLSHD